MKTILLSLLAILSFNSISHAGGVASGGGDTCENRIQTIRDDLEKWILNGGHYGLLLDNVSTGDYETKMLHSMKSAKIKCVGHSDNNYPVTILSTPKECKFEKNENRQSIFCDIEKFNSISEEEQYVLIHHEYAGLAGIENPKTDISNYNISNQLSGFLEEQVVKKLAVNPGKKENSCTSLQKKYRKSIIEETIGNDSLKMISELASDANLTANISRSLFAASSFILTRSYSRMLVPPHSSGFHFIEATVLHKFVLAPLMIANMSYSAGQHLISAYTENNFTSLINEKISANDILLNFDRSLNEIRILRSQIDLDWSRFLNSITLGGIAERRTANLLSTYTAEQAVYQKKSQFIKQLLIARDCSISKGVN